MAGGGGGSRTNSRWCFLDCENLFWEVLCPFNPSVRLILPLVGALCGRVRLPNFYLLRRDLLVSRFVFSGKILSAVDGSRTNSRCCFLDCGSLFWEVACPFNPSVRLILPLGRRSLRAGSTPGIFCYDFIGCFRI